MFVLQILDSECEIKRVSGTGTGTHGPSASVVKSRSLAEKLKMSRMMDVGCSMLAVESRSVNSSGNGLSLMVS